MEFELRKSVVKYVKIKIKLTIFKSALIRDTQM